MAHHKRKFKRKPGRPRKVENAPLTEPVPATHCPKCGQPRDTKGFAQGYKHGKDVVCDECHETWVRLGFGDDRWEMLPSVRQRKKHKSTWD